MYDLQTVILGRINLADAEEEIVVSSGVKTIVIPASAIQALLDKTLRKDIDTTIARMRVDDGEWKSIPASGLSDQAISIIGESRGIELQLVSEENKPVEYSIPIQKTSSSKFD